jgi:hypothetical protein
MQVILQSNWFAPGGVMYRKGHDGAPVVIPNRLKDKLPKTAKVLKDGEKVAIQKDLPLDSRPKPGSGDPNADENVGDDGKSEASETDAQKADLGRQAAKAQSEGLARKGAK